MSVYKAGQMFATQQNNRISIMIIVKVRILTCITVIADERAPLQKGACVIDVYDVWVGAITVTGFLTFSKQRFKEYCDNLNYFLVE